MFDLFRKKKWLENLSEKILVKKAKKGDGEAYGELYLKYLDGIYRYIFFRVNQKREDAEDLSEVVFFKAWKSIADFKEENFRSWIYKIAHNTVLDFYKKEGRTVSLTEEIIDASINVEEKVLLSVEMEAMEKAINNLDHDQKAVLMMKFIEGLSNKEIAEILGKNEDTVRMIQHRGLKRLRELLRAKS